MAYNSPRERKNKLSDILNIYEDFKDIKSLLLLYAYNSETPNRALPTILSQLQDLYDSLDKFEEYEVNQIGPIEI